MSLRDNLITLLNKYFYKREEKPVKYSQWLTSQYENGTWYLGVKTIEQKVISVEKTIIRPSNPQVISFNITLNKIHSQQEYNVTGLTNATINENDNQINLVCSFPSTYTGGLTLTLKEYYDEENDKLYKGCSWRDE